MRLNAVAALSPDGRFYADVYTDDLVHLWTGPYRDVASEALEDGRKWVRGASALQVDVLRAFDRLYDHLAELNLHDATDRHDTLVLSGALRMVAKSVQYVADIRRDPNGYL